MQNEKNKWEWLSYLPFYICFILFIAVMFAFSIIITSIKTVYDWVKGTK